MNRKLKASVERINVVVSDYDFTHILRAVLVLEGQSTKYITTKPEQWEIVSDVELFDYLDDNVLPNSPAARNIDWSEFISAFHNVQDKYGLDTEEDYCELQYGLDTGEDHYELPG